MTKMYHVFPKAKGWLLLMCLLSLLISKNTKEKSQTWTQEHSEANEFNWL